MIWIVCGASNLNSVKSWLKTKKYSPVAGKHNLYVLCRNWITELNPNSPKLILKLSLTAIARCSFVNPWGGVRLFQLSSIKKYLFLKRTISTLLPLLLCLWFNSAPGILVVIARFFLIVSWPFFFFFFMVFLQRWPHKRF